MRASEMTQKTGYNWLSSDELVVMKCQNSIHYSKEILDNHLSWESDGTGAKRSFEDEMAAAEVLGGVEPPGPSGRERRLKR